MKLQQPKINKDTPVRIVKMPEGVMKAKRRYKKPKYKSSVCEYNEKFELVDFALLRFEERG